MDIDEHLPKSYRLIESTNFDEFLKVLGDEGCATSVIRRLQAFFVELNKIGDEYIFESIIDGQQAILRFTPNVGIVSASVLDPKKTESTFYVGGSTCCEFQQHLTTGTMSTIETTWSQDKMKMVCSINDVKATKLYKAINNTSLRQNPK